MDLNFFKKKRPSIPSNSTFRITQEGQERLQKYSGDPKSQILMALETHGTSDLQEISEASALSKGQVERLIPVLIRSGYVQFVTASGAE